MSRLVKLIGGPVVFFLIFNLSGFAQNFGEGNPVWNYNVSSGWGGLSYHVRMSIKKDTVFQGKQCKVLNRDAGSFENFMPYGDIVCQDSSKVIFWSAELMEFQTLYDLSAVKGDRWHVKLDGWHGSPNEHGISYIIIDSVYSVTINNNILLAQNLRIWHDSIQSKYEGYELTVYEGIGCTQFLFPWDGSEWDWDYVDGLRCFENDSIGFHQFVTYVACDYTQVGLEEPSNAHGISISPNPFAGVFTVSTGLPIMSIQVTDLQGKTIYRTKPSSSDINNFEVVLDQFISGIYIVEVGLKNGTKQRQKLVLQL